MNSFSSERNNLILIPEVGFVWLCLGLLLCVGCGRETEAAAAVENPDITVNVITDEDKPKPVIKIVANNWGSSEVTAEIAKQLIASELGYETEIVKLDESAQWAELSAGDAHISLEVWPSGNQDNMQEFIENQQTVEFAGFLGPIGKVSWYVPFYMVDENPALRSWEAYRDEETALMFETAETLGKGQFLGPAESDLTFDAAIITNLELPFEVVYAGSEDGIIAGAEAAIARQDPILFYFWTPHSLHAKHDLVPIELPPFYLTCWEEPEKADCDYPEENLFKIVWYLLDEEAPEVYGFVRRMRLTLDDQIGMLGEMEADEIEPAKAASHWIEANETTWQRWIP